MGDEFNIGSVEKLIANIPEIELSDISKIIKKMIHVKNDISRERQKKTMPYDINDKISLNKFTDNLKVKIKKYHIDSYDIVDDAISCIEEVEAFIKSDLYDYYWDVYVDVLMDLDININEEEIIKGNSDNIYINLLEKIDKQLFAERHSDIETNKKITYLNAITAYVFYECKFLIPIK